MMYSLNVIVQCINICICIKAPYIYVETSNIDGETNLKILGNKCIIKQLNENTINPIKKSAGVVGFFLSKSIQNLIKSLLIYLFIIGFIIIEKKPRKPIRVST